MYGRIVGSSSQSTSAIQADESSHSDDEGFAERLAGMAPDAGPSSSQAATRPYSVLSKPPIFEIDIDAFGKEVKAFYGDDIKQIAENKLSEYPDFISTKAQRAANVARTYGHTDEDTVEARYYAYRLGDKTVGLLRTEGELRVGGRRFSAQFPGRDAVTSQVDLRVTHPLVENAGDILLEHQLRQDGERALIMSKPALPGIEQRLAQMGFVPVSDKNHWVLDPHQHPDKWTHNAEGKWQRVGKPEGYLAAESSGAQAKIERAPSEASDETESSGDDTSWYFERLNLGPSSAGE
ncbi:host specificity protein [Bradyrhizobium sp. CCBAU 51627]|uniref:host specificity protein n=1 Tax=Bradyrhizobium sp. CCBAU 51627 TaxID=1325088 RepID=UPI00230668C8|nr:host specificity protein [Bradyrhizobium sp. CCBAU 51627]MDA9437131.1 host specificity protein [Bradyrhizobium sp. CCBAU 51627]